MKSILLIAVMCCGIVTTSVSQKIKLVSGSLDFLKTEQSFNVRFTYENMLVGKLSEEEYVKKKVEQSNEKEAGKGDAWHKAWISDREERFQPKFIELYNKYASEKGKPVIDNNSDAEYTLLLNTYYTEPGFNVGVVRHSAEVSIKGVFVNKNQENIAVVTIVKASAKDFWGTDFETGYRLQETYAVAGRGLAKFIIKQVK
ncbi:MAG: hypothetical protein LBR10_08000 [Prevotellaceae bacterium]|jgi:hypothetical protein|nr:hypothetical protein [Prevotellaceae bacterium]